jgi:hypothetical protein
MPHHEIGRCGTVRWLIGGGAVSHHQYSHEVAFDTELLLHRRLRDEDVSHERCAEAERLIRQPHVLDGSTDAENL